MNESPHDLVAAYALDALDEDERERFERHLEECEECTEQLALLREPVAALAYAAEGPAPPEALRGRIIERVRAEPRAAVIRMPRRRNWPLAAVAGVAAAAACLAIGLGVWANSLSNSLDQEQRVTSVYEQFVRSGATAQPLIGADGLLLVANDGRAALVVCDLAEAPSAKTYEAWVITGETPRPAGLFRGGNGCNPVVLTERVPNAATVAVTLEDAGGATSPTLPILIRGQAT
jgi:anti-sigma-K factor RskA